MSVNVTVVDYGVGNLLSVSKAFEHCGATVTFADTSAAIEKADYLVLPGVGAFASAMLALKERNLIEGIKSFASKERPFLGICLGMQLMLSETEEFGLHAGLDLISGKVVRISSSRLDGARLKVPHIAWKKVSSSSPEVDGKSFYFIHSYHAMPEDHADLFATCDYGGREITAMIKKDNLLGCQFHPEKSAEAGLNLLSEFIRL